MTIEADPKPEPMKTLLTSHFAVAGETVEGEKKEPVVIIKEVPAPISKTEKKPKRLLKFDSFVTQEEILQPKKPPPPIPSPIKIKPIHKVFE